MNYKRTLPNEKGQLTCEISNGTAKTTIEVTSPLSELFMNKIPKEYNDKYISNE